MNKDVWSTLESMRDTLDDLLEAKEGTGERALPERAVYRMRFSEVQQALNAGLGGIFHIGDEIWNQNRLVKDPICWIVIGKGEDEMTLWAVQGLPSMPFDEPSKKYPYGHALWRDCSSRRWLNGDLLAGFLPEDAQAVCAVKKETIAPNKDGGGLIETEDKLWLLSACEAGFTPDDDWSEAEGSAFPYFGSDEAKRIGGWWRLRSAGRAGASYAWYVSASGYGSYTSSAAYAFRLAPACVIRKS